MIINDQARANGIAMCSKVELVWGGMGKLSSWDMGESGTHPRLCLLSQDLL